MALKERHLADGEQVVLSLRTHWKALLAPLALLLFLLVGVGLLWFFSRDASWGGWATLVVGALALIAVAAFVFIPIWRWNSTRYVITNRRISYRSGLLTKVGRDIPLHRVNDLEIEKHLLDRMLGCGTLVISDATDKAGMLLRDVPAVERVKVQIQNLLYQRDDGSDDGEYPPNEPPRPRGQY